MRRESAPFWQRIVMGAMGPDQQQSGLRVDSREALLKGGKRGPAIVPGAPEQSLLVKAIRHDGLNMPIGSRLKDSEIAAFEEWIRNDAPWPSAAISKTTSRKERYQHLAREHWAFQRVSAPTASGCASNPAWSKTALDRFILARLQQSGLSPCQTCRQANPDAPAELCSDRIAPDGGGSGPVCCRLSSGRIRSSGRSHSRVLRTSESIGRAIGLIWCDTARRAAMNGITRSSAPGDIVITLIRAFNADVPYNQLVREHIAGDLLEQPRIDPKAGINESVIGTAFYQIRGSRAR